MAAAAMAPRGDFSRFGIVGHSMGGGAVPYLAQRAAARGWISEMKGSAGVPARVVVGSTREFEVSPARRVSVVDVQASTISMMDPGGASSVSTVRRAASSTWTRGGRGGSWSLYQVPGP